MDAPLRRRLKEGISLGIVAGIVFVLAQMIITSMTGELGLMPLRLFASVLMGEAALTTTALGPTVLAGIVLHFLFSIMLGVLYGWLDERLPLEIRISRSWQSLLGVVFGFLLWFVDFQLIARLAFPWFLLAPQGLEMLMHVLFFGLPLGLMFSSYARRALRMDRYAMIA